LRPQFPVPTSSWRQIRDRSMGANCVASPSLVRWA
jgi:hypothetical protein